MAEAIPSREEDTLAAALERAAADLEAVLVEATAAHEQYVRACTAAPQRGIDAVSEEVRHRRTHVALYAAGLLVEHLRTESLGARERFPELDATGAHRPLRPPNDNPDVVHRWWQGLDEATREDIIVHSPAWVGQADGLPVLARHRANMVLLEAEIERRATQAEPGGMPEGEGPSEEELRDLRGLLKLRALLDPASQAEEDSQDAADSKGLKDRTVTALEKVTTPLHERYLYLLDARAYPLKTAIVLGELETATHVVVHVPGATTTVDLRLFREAEWMSNLRNEAARYAGGTEQVAVIDWIGYQAPYDIAVRTALGDSKLSLIMPGQAADDRYAREAAPDLVRCAQGVRLVCRQDAWLVASGHSYGGAVVGLALAETDAFDVAMVSGCPGLFTNDLHTLRLPPGRMYVAASPGDVVPLLGIFGGQVLQIPGIKFISPYARAITGPDGARAFLLPTFGHETYYNPGTATLQAFAAIAANALEKVKTTTWFGVQRVAPPLKPAMSDPPRPN
ncbi:alpha/beta hydrolase [Gephyromycinifex aptenodytis]|uniref:alpha/beta hydrolase n=1 Tax=Gephyromycinifex aptenodytis TaxID=2716227 RepID=UPI001445B736|nr:alpha/beta hydrolase [Gephyromycinifex aptenodytis]